jgi:hypothetical protein
LVVLNCTYIVVTGTFGCTAVVAVTVVIVIGPFGCTAVVAVVVVVNAIQNQR